MALDQPMTIDAVGTEIGTGIVVLTIIDAWDWSDEQAHLRALQDKLNAYLEFTESGQLVETYPDAGGASLRIEIIARYAAPPSGADYLERVKRQLADLGLGLTHRVLSDPTGAGEQDTP